MVRHGQQEIAARVRVRVIFAIDHDIGVVVAGLPGHAQIPAGDLRLGDMDFRPRLGRESGRRGGQQQTQQWNSPAPGHCLCVALPRLAPSQR
jgi:hypothetical protein